MNSDTLASPERPWPTLISAQESRKAFTHLRYGGVVLGLPGAVATSFAASEARRGLWRRLLSRPAQRLVLGRRSNLGPFLVGRRGSAGEGGHAGNDGVPCKAEPADEDIVGGRMGYRWLLSGRKSNLPVMRTTLTSGDESTDVLTWKRFVTTGLGLTADDGGEFS